MVSIAMSSFTPWISLWFVFANFSTFIIIKVITVHPPIVSTITQGCDKVAYEIMFKILISILLQISFLKLIIMFCIIPIIPKNFLNFYNFFFILVIKFNSKTLKQ